MSSKLYLVCRKHPIDPPKDKDRLEITWRRHKLSTLVRKYMGDFNHVTCWVNSNKLNDEDVLNYRTRPGDCIVMAPTLQDPVGGFVWALSTFAGTAAAGTTTAAGTTVTLGKAVTLAVTSLAIKGAITYGISYGIQSLAKKDTDKPAIAQSSSELAYSWGEFTHQQARLPMPMVFGKLGSLGGNIINSHTTIDDNDNETLNLLLSYGFGVPWKGLVEGSVKLADRSLDFFSNVLTESRNGTMNQTAISYFPQTKCEYRLGREILNSSGPVVFSTPYSDFTDIEISITWRSRTINPGGEYGNYSTGLKIDISEYQAGVWTSLVNTELINYTDAVRKSMYKASGTYDGGSPVTISAGTRYDIRVTKTTGDVVPGVVTVYNNLSEIYLTSIREVVDAEFVHQGQPLLGISALATDELSGTFSVSCEWETSVCQVYDGATWTIEFTRNPAWVIYHLLTLPIINGEGTEADPYVVEGYQGYQPATLANMLDDLVDLATRCDQTVSDGDGGTVARYTFDGKFDSTETQWDVIQNVARCCDSEVRPYGTGFKLYVDKPWSGDVRTLFSAGNIIPETYHESEIASIDKCSDFEMDIQDADSDYDSATVPYYNALAGNSAKVFEADGFGITNKTMASRKLYRLAAQNELVNWVCRFRVALDALNCQVMDVIDVAAPWLRDGRVASYVFPKTLTLDRAHTDSGADSVILRTYDSVTGTDKVEVITVSSITDETVELATTPSVSPIPNETVYAFGPTADVVKQWRVKGITQFTDDQMGIVHEIQCEEYNAGVYPADNYDPTVFFDSFVTPETGGKPIQALTPAQIEANKYQYIAEVLRTTGRRATHTQDGTTVYPETPGGGVIGTIVNGGSGIVIGTTVNGGDNATCGAGVLGRFGDVSTGVIFTESSSQAAIAPLRLIDRGADPTSGVQGDVALVSNGWRLCTVSGTPGTWIDL